MTVDELLGHLENVKKSGTGHTAKCPAHEDDHNSLSVTAGSDGKLLLYCHASCSFEQIIAAVPSGNGRTNGASHSPRSTWSSRPFARTVARYDYHNADGTLAYYVNRTIDKNFPTFRPDGSKIGDTPRVLYHLPAILAAPGSQVVVVEGEKDADRLTEMGLLATTSPQGAGKWRPEYAEALQGRKVIVIPDNDDAGRAHAQDVVRSLVGARVLDLPGLAPKEDVSDWLDAGHEVEELHELLKDQPEPEKANGLRFYTPLQLASMTAEHPEWVVGPGLLALGAITEIDGKIKAAGKTTLALHMVRSVLDGTDFLGHPTRQARILYVTEQSKQTFTDALRWVGLSGRGPELRVLFREDLRGIAWPDVVAACRQDDYEVVVFDTIGKLAGIKEENSAGEWATAMSPLQDLAASARAVVVCRHDRKGGGEVGDSGRGSSQASGDVDVILALRRPEGNQPSNRRVIESLSRYRETPDKIVVELTGDGYVLLGTDEAVALSEARAFVSALIGPEIGQKQNSTMDDLVTAGKEQSPPVSRTSIQRALESLVAEGLISMSGAGKRGSPHLFSAVTTGEKVSALTQMLGGQKETPDPQGWMTVDQAIAQLEVTKP